MQYLVLTFDENRLKTHDGTGLKGETFDFSNDRVPENRLYFKINGDFDNAVEDNVIER